MHRATRFVLLGLVLAVVGGCNRAELEQKTEEVAAERARAAELDKSLREAQAVLETATADLAASRDQVRLLETELEEARAEADELETTERELKEVKGHRDELIEWIQDELLPIAEEHDPRLVELREQTEAMQKAVEELRGLPFKRPLMSRLIRRKQVGEWMERDARKQLPEEEAEAMVAVMARFGMLAPDTDLYEMFAGFMQDAVAAFYRPDTSTFYLVEGNTGAANNPVIFHELVHAVDDQHYDLAAMQRAVSDESDAGLALKGLVEGCADLFQTAYHQAHPEDLAAMTKQAMSPKAMQQQIRMVQEAPTFLVAMMALYPYKNGSAFLRALGVETAEDMARLFEDPPVSTEQMLHPEKFATDGSRDYPRRVEPPKIGSILGDGWTDLEDSDMGELGIGLMLAHMTVDNPGIRLVTLMDQKTQGVKLKGFVGKAAAGWDGDRFSAFRRDDGDREVCVAWSTVWDSEGDAAEFAKTYGTALGKQVTGSIVKDLASPIRFDEENGSVSTVVQEGNRVFVVLGAPAQHVDALLRATADAKIEADPRDPND